MTMNQFKVGDKVIYHGGGTLQTMDAMGSIGTVTRASFSSGQVGPRESITAVIWDNGPYARRESTWYTSNLDLYEEDDV